MRLEIMHGLPHRDPGRSAGEIHDRWSTWEHEVRQSPRRGGAHKRVGKDIKEISQRTSSLSYLGAYCISSVSILRCASPMS